MSKKEPSRRDFLKALGILSAAAALGKLSESNAEASEALAASPAEAATLNYKFNDKENILIRRYKMVRLKFDNKEDLFIIDTHPKSSDGLWYLVRPKTKEYEDPEYEPLKQAVEQSLGNSQEKIQRFLKAWEQRTREEMDQLVATCPRPTRLFKVKEGYPMDR